MATHDRRGDGHNLRGGRNDHGKGPDRDGEDRHGDDNGAGYNFVARAPGYGHVRFRIDDLRPGENRVVTIEFPRNVASATAGATASGDGTDQANLIDETEGTQWTSIGTTDVAGRQVLITLAGRQTFRVVKVSALLGPGQNRFTALRSFELLACDAGKTTCDPASTSRLEARPRLGGRCVPVGEPEADRTRPDHAGVEGADDVGDPRAVPRSREPVLRAAVASRASRTTTRPTRPTAASPR